MRWPPMFVWPLAGQANSSLLPPQPARPEARRSRPRAPRQEARQRHKPDARHVLSAPQAEPDMCPPRRESGQLLLRLRCSCLRVWASAELAALTTAPNSSPTSGRPCSAPGLTACPTTPKPRPGAAHYRPEVGRARPPRPNTNRARQIGLRSVRDCHEGCSRFQTQELLSAVPPRCRIPLAREPSAHGDPAASSQASCRGRNTVGLRRPGALKITASCVQRPWPARDAPCFRPAALTLRPRRSAQCSRQAVLASFTPAPHSAFLSSYARAEKREQKVRRP